MDENEYRIIGIIYAILGVELFFFLIFNESVLRGLFDVGIYFSWCSFLLSSFSVVGSLVLAFFGVILVVRGGVWVARVSGVLFVFLLLMFVGSIPAIAYVL